MTNPPSADTVVVCAAVGGLVALVVTTIVVPATIGLARRWGIIDEPGARSSHTVATPRLGGIGVGLGALAGLATAAAIDPSALDAVEAPMLHLGLALAAIAVGFGIIGLADDLLRGLPVSVRLIAQVVVATAAIVPWVAADRGGARAADPSFLVLAAVAVLGTMWLIGYVNAFNFMDGIDGISGFVAVVVGIDLVAVGAFDDRALLVVAGAVLAGTAIGFLRLNLRPATVFLGDGGSYFLGAWIAMAAVIGIGVGTPPEAVIAVTIPYLADTATTLVRRVARGADWRASHHEHAYQQLIDLGWSHHATAAAVAGVSALCAALGSVSLVAGPIGRIAAAAAVVGVAAGYVASPALVRRRQAPLDLSTGHEPAEVVPPALAARPSPDAVVDRSSAPAGSSIAGG